MILWYWQKSEKVAPFAGAWIEILRTLKICLVLIGRSLRGSVDWNTCKRRFKIYLRRSLRGSVDWNPLDARSAFTKFCRSLRGSVDWNRDWLMELRAWLVAPFAGAWIEIAMLSCDPVFYIGRSLRGSVDWNLLQQGRFLFYSVAPFAGAWIEISLQSNFCPHPESLPSRERGLKLTVLNSWSSKLLSLPSRERGLK